MRRFTVATLALSLALAAAAPGARGADTSPSYTFKFSGYFKADAAYDQTRVNSGNYGLYVLDKAENNLLSITARETRLGLDFSWKENEIETAAKLELDFYGLGVSSATLNSQDNKATSMLRHAYVQLTKGRLSFLAGQTSDIMSPLAPKTVNYTVCWDQGNIGYRRPQFRVSGWVSASDRVKLSASVGAARSLGGDLDGDKIDDGADAGIPVAEGRLALSAKLGEKNAFDLGVSGHYGTEEYEAASETKDITSWSGNVDCRLTVSDFFELAGEFFVGQDLGTYFGGVGQTVNLMKDEIASTGGWGQISVKFAERFWVNAGYGVDDPDEEDFAIPVGTTDKQAFIDLNSTIFGSVFCNVTSTVTAMLEVSQLTTDYLYKIYADDELRKSGGSYDDLRVQLALKAAIK